MSQDKFTILLPVHRPPVLLPIAVDTVLTQNYENFELFIVCDGAPPATGAYTRDLERQDSRVRAFVHPKGERHGEAWRHAALEHASGRYVAHINDDDLWFPNHLGELEKLLCKVDFGNLLHVNVMPSGQPRCIFADLNDDLLRARMLRRGYNIFGPTAAGYTLDAYRRLPSGWSPAPAGLYSDLYMWRKFLSAPGYTCSTRFVVTSLHFLDSELFPQIKIDLEGKRTTMERWRAQTSDPAARDAIIQAVFRNLYFEHAEETRELQARVKSILKNKWWRLTAPLRWIGGLLTRDGKL